MLVAFLRSQRRLQYRYRLPTQDDPLPFCRHADYAAARGRLKADHALFAETLLPEGRQAAVGGTGHRIFVDPGAWCEEARDKIEFRIGRRRGDNYSSCSQAAQPGII